MSFCDQIFTIYYRNLCKIGKNVGPYKIWSHVVTVPRLLQGFYFPYFYHLDRSIIFLLNRSKQGLIINTRKLTDLKMKFPTSFTGLPQDPNQSHPHPQGHSFNEPRMKQPYNDPRLKQVVSSVIDINAF